jgi:hypothetical protein
MALWDGLGWLGRLWKKETKEVIPFYPAKISLVLSGRPADPFTTPAALLLFPFTPYLLSPVPLGCLKESCSRSAQEGKTFSRVVILKIELKPYMISRSTTWQEDLLA